jgi:pimeloyl-ACP methyl ester carboxylesterase
MASSHAFLIHTGESVMSETVSGYAPVANGELYYEVTGQGTPLVLIHAGVADLRMWQPQVAAFAGRCRVICYDTRTFGKTRTTDPDGEYSNRQDVIDLLNHLGVDRAVLAGCSRGGQIAVDTALEFPDRVRALVPICAGLSGFDYDAHTPVNERDEFNRLDAMGSAEHPNCAEIARLEAEIWVNGFYREGGDRAPQAVYDYVYAVCLDQCQRYTSGAKYGSPITLEPKAVERLSDLRVPMLVVIGTLDTADTRAVADHLAAHVAGARKAPIDGTAHLPSLEKPDAFNRALAAFLDEIGA